jgi:hypothetical protein
VRNLAVEYVSVEGVVQAPGHAGEAPPGGFAHEASRTRSTGLSPHPSVAPASGAEDDRSAPAAGDDGSGVKRRRQPKAERLLDDAPRARGAMMQGDAERQRVACHIPESS